MKSWALCFVARAIGGSKPYRGITALLQGVSFNPWLQLHGTLSLSSGFQSGQSPRVAT